MNRKLVSVITPCYNSGKFIHRLLETILEQDYPCLEMYVIDDGSVDCLLYTSPSPRDTR